MDNELILSEVKRIKMDSDKGPYYMTLTSSKFPIQKIMELLGSNYIYEKRVDFSGKRKHTYYMITRIRKGK